MNGLAGPEIECSFEPRTILGILGTLFSLTLATAAQAERPCRIVVFDTADTSQAYSPQLFGQGETNAHYIVDQIYKTDLGFRKIALPAIIGITYQAGRDAFLDPPPDLAIIHRSALDHRNTATGEAELALLVGASKPPTRFLIYSRNPTRTTPMLLALRKGRMHRDVSGLSALLEPTLSQPLRSCRPCCMKPWRFFRRAAASEPLGALTESSHRSSPNIAPSTRARHTVACKLRSGIGISEHHYDA